MKVVINKSERLLKTPQALMGKMRLTERLLKSRGVEYIDLDPILPELPDLPEFAEKISQISDSNHTPGDAASMFALKEAIAHLYSEIYARKINPIKDIAITPGSRLTAMLICLALVNPDESVAIPDPGLAMYRMGTVMAGGIPQAYPLLEKNDFLPNLSALFGSPAKNLRLIFLNYPQNPTGAEAELYFYRELTGHPREGKVLIVLDSPYCGQPDPPIDLPLQLNKTSRLFVELHSFGFPYGLDGLGFAIGHRGAIANIEQAVEAIGFRPGASQIKYALTALELHQELSQRFQAKISSRRKLLTDGLKEMGWQVRAGRLVPFIWAKVPPRVTSAGFARKMFLSTGVRVRPGSDFGGNGEGYLRFSLTFSEDKIARALQNIRNKPSMYRRTKG